MKMEIPESSHVESEVELVVKSGTKGLIVSNLIHLLILIWERMDVEYGIYNEEN